VRAHAISELQLNFQIPSEDAKYFKKSPKVTENFPFYTFDNKPYFSAEPT